MNKALLHKEVQDYLEKNYREDISKIIFKGSAFPEITTQELAVQLTGKKKAEKKIPTWFSARGIIYPPVINLEQTSSEKTAGYKASLVSGNSIVDLTGGFGIDSFSFSKKFPKVIHCEINRELSEIVKHNVKVLNKKNIEFYLGSGIEFLNTTPESFDWVFIDPSRRNDSGGRVFKLSDCLPNIPEHLDLLWQKADHIMIKTSPLLDLQAGLRELKKVKEVHIIAVENEVKELLWILKKETSKGIKVKTINFRSKGNHYYQSYLGSGEGAAFHTPLTYLYEPNAAIMKSGLFDALGTDLGLFKLHPNTHLYTSKELIDFPGRRFKIDQILPYKKKAVKAGIKENKAHITTRNFPESVATIRKKLNFKDGGTTYLFFTTIENNEKVVLVCQKQ